MEQLTVDLTAEDAQDLDAIVGHCARGPSGIELSLVPERSASPWANSPHAASTTVRTVPTDTNQPYSVRPPPRHSTRSSTPPGPGPRSPRPDGTPARR